MAGQSLTNTTSNEIVEALVPDPAQVPDLRVLVGLLGRSTRPGYRRLYLTIALCDYLEIAEGDLVHSVLIENSPIRAHLVWLAREANWIRVRTQTRAHAGDTDGFQRIDLSYHGQSCHYIMDKVHL